MSSLSVLVVDDSVEKVRRITKAILEVDETLQDGIDHALSSHIAKQFVLKKHYDLLVLDIAIPPRLEADIQRKGGLDLLDEILRRDKYRTPGFIVGITAHEDLMGPASLRFAEDLLSVVQYDPRSDLWERQLKACIQRLIATKLADNTVPNYGVQAVLVCALQDELQSLLRNGWSWERLSVEGDHTPYNIASVNVDGRTLRVVAAAATRMGMPTTASLAMKMLSRFRPRYIGMPGVTAARRGRAHLGDVIVGDPVWDWGSGKWGLQGDKLKFFPEPNQLPLDPRVRSAFQQIADDHETLAQIRHSWIGEKPNRELSVRIGPAASGSAVIADDGTILQQIESQQRKVVGVDMEAFGIFAAANDAPSPRPIAFSAKSVVDFADGSKDDSARLYALHTSAQVVRHFIEQYSAATP